MSEKYNYINNFLEGKIGWEDLDNDTEKTEVIKQVIKAIDNVCSDLAKDISILRKDKNELKERVEKLEQSLLSEVYKDNTKRVDIITSVLKNFLEESSFLGGGDQLPESFFQDSLKKLLGDSKPDKKISGKRFTITNESQWSFWDLFDKTVKQLEDSKKSISRIGIEQTIIRFLERLPSGDYSNLREEWNKREVKEKTRSDEDIGPIEEDSLG